MMPVKQYFGQGGKDHGWLWWCAAGCIHRGQWKHPSKDAALAAYKEHSRRKHGKVVPEQPVAEQPGFRLEAEEVPEFKVEVRAEDWPPDGNPDYPPSRKGGGGVPRGD